MILPRNYYEEDERIFSTGNEELDDLLEEVYFSGIEDGYYYAQKEFVSNRKVKKAQLMKANAKIDVINNTKTLNELRESRAPRHQAAQASLNKTKTGRLINNNPEVLSDSAFDHLINQNRRVNKAYKKKSRQLVRQAISGGRVK